MLSRRIFVVLAMFLYLSCPAHASEMVYPSPDIAPAEVIAIQLNSLRYNDNPEVDFGIRQTWTFAHPRNRAVTGPLPRFASMLKSPSYGAMLNHISHSVELAGTGEGWRKFDVFMEAANGDVLQFSWVVEKVNTGRHKDCWMTVAVSAPRLSGQGS